MASLEAKINSLPDIFRFSDLEKAGIFKSQTVRVWCFRGKGPPCFLKDGIKHIHKSDFIKWNSGRIDGRTRKARNMKSVGVQQ